MFYKMHIIDLKNDDSEFPVIEVTRYAFWPITDAIFYKMQYVLVIQGE